jgi:hypothetical protein
MKQLSTVIFFLIIFSSCSKEEALYADSLGNIITNDSRKHPITGKRSFQCTKYFSSGSVWESYEFETVIASTHKENIFIIGPVKLDKYGTSGEKIETNSNFSLDDEGELRASNLKSNYDYMYSLYGIYDSTTNKIRLTLRESGGRYCGCDEK